jgi:hypothetical protein
VAQRFEARDAVVRRRNLLVHALSFAPFVAFAGVVLSALLSGGPMSIGLLPPLLIAGLTSVWAVWHQNPLAREKRASVTASREGLFLGEERVAREELVEGETRATETGAIVRIQRRGVRPPIEVAVASVEQAEALLRALGLHVSQRLDRFRVGPPVAAHPSLIYWVMLTTLMLLGVVGTAIHALIDGSGAFLAIGFPLVLGAVFAGLFSSTDLTIGADGVTLRWLGRLRFVPFGEVDVVMPFQDGFGNRVSAGALIRLKNGREIRIPVADSLMKPEVLSVVKALATALTSYREVDASSDASALRRGQTSVAAWIQRLRSMGLGSHRTAALDVDLLWRVVEDRTALPSARAAAAVALGNDASEATRVRLRDVAEASIAPKLRIAIEAAADEEEATLEAALAELEAADGESVSRRLPQA